MGHLLAWQENALAVATELAVNETSADEGAVPTPTGTRRGDAINDEIDATWAALPMTEVRERFATIPGQLRGYLTVVPETRWLKHADHQTLLPRRDDRPLRGAPGRPRGDPRGRRPMTLRDLLAEEAADLPGAEASRRTRRLDHLVARRPTLRRRVRRRILRRFALDPAVADAATRTPDVTPSSARPRLGHLHPDRPRRPRRRPRGRVARLSPPTPRTQELDRRAAAPTGARPAVR